MKKILKYITLPVVGTVMLSGLTSCEDFLEVDPQDKPTVESYYVSAERVRMSTAALYSAWEWKNYCMDFQWKFDMLSGDMYYTYSEEGQFYFGTFGNNNAYLKQGWEGLYNVIAVANSIINDMPAAAASNGVDQADINLGVGEARMIRGVCYFLLSQYWGDVPIITNGAQMVETGSFQVPRNTRYSVYKFAEKDLQFAAENLKLSDEPGRPTRYSALAYLAKLHLTMASHADRSDRAALYAQAASEADEVITNSADVKTIDFSTLFDKEANNGPESLLAIQCMVYGYGYGNGRNCAFARVSLADQAWGNGKGPTINLQQLYDSNDNRRMWTFMQYGDYYPNIEKSKGGYTYDIYNEDRGDESNEMCSHLKKYVLGHSADVDGGIGSAQDAPNNIYLMRLADVYFTYAEAVMGEADQTSDQTAIDRVNAVRDRAGLAGYRAPMTWQDLISEKRREFAIEGSNWFDVLRWYYRDAQGALDYLNSMNRHWMYLKPDDKAQYNNPAAYKLAKSKDEWGMYDASDIMLTMNSFVMPLPASAVTASPQLNDAPVEYEFTEE